MFLTCCERTPLLHWALLFALVAVSPASPILPWGIALVMMAFLGTTVFVRRAHLEPQPAVPAPRRAAAARID